MTRRAEIHLTLTLQSPFLMQGLGGTVLGVDAAALRDEVERPLVPADQVKGLLRAACVTLERATDGAVVNAVEIDALFGSRSPDRKDDGSEQDRPLRGALIFGDLVAEKSSTCGTITRVHIDPVTGPPTPVIYRRWTWWPRLAGRSSSAAG